MPQGEGLLVALVLIPIPAMGSHPRVARFLCAPPSSRIVLATLLALSLGAAALSLADRLAPHLVILFAAPLYQACLLRFLYRRFLRVHGREPADVAFNFDSGLFHDRAFAFANFFGGLFPPAGLLGWAVWGTGIPPAVQQGLAADTSQLGVTVSGSLLASNSCGFGETSQRWLAQLKPDPLGGAMALLKQCGRVFYLSAIGAVLLLAAGLAFPGTVNLADIDPSYPPEYVAARGFPLQWLVTDIPAELGIESPPRIYPYGLGASLTALYILSLAVGSISLALRGVARLAIRRWRAA